MIPHCLEIVGSSIEEKLEFLIVMVNWILHFFLAYLKSLLLILIKIHRIFFDNYNQSIYLSSEQKKICCSKIQDINDKTLIVYMFAFCSLSNIDIRRYLMNGNPKIIAVMITTGDTWVKIKNGLIVQVAGLIYGESSHSQAMSRSEQCNLPSILLLIAGILFFNGRVKCELTTVVETDKGPIVGEILKTVVDALPYASFRGIPYARPPISDLRFQASRKFTEIFMTYDQTSCQ